MNLTMVGTGYVGLVTGACFAETGNHVTCLDVDDRKIAMLNRGESPIYEPGLSEMIVRNAEAGRLLFTTDKMEAYRDADAIFICVGTPPGEDGSADLKYVLQVAADIAEAIEALGKDHGESPAGGEAPLLPPPVEVAPPPALPAPAPPARDRVTRYRPRARSNPRQRGR